MKLSRRFRVSRGVSPPPAQAGATASLLRAGALERRWLFALTPQFGASYNCRTSFMRATRGERGMKRFASYLGVIGAALILALAPDKTAAQTQVQTEHALPEQAQALAE